MKKMLAVRILSVITILFIGNLVWTGSPSGGSTALAAYSSCGAYVAPGVWKEFDCYNLAAIGKTTKDDPFTPSWRLIGGYWQWGRKGPDASQWHNTNTPNFAHGPTGPGDSEANDGSISGWDSSDALDGAWSDASKTANDPCPAGFRVPTISQWEGVVDNNTQSTVGTWSFPTTNYDSARFFGDKLLLPAAGLRSGDSGTLDSRGRNGYYWSSSEYAQQLYARYLSFYSGNAYTNSYYRRRGLSVRCVAEDSTSQQPALTVAKTSFTLNPGDTDTVSINGGTGYYTSANSSNGNIATASFQSSNIVSIFGLSPGTATVTVIDSSGATTLISVTVANQTSNATIQVDGYANDWINIQPYMTDPQYDTQCNDDTDIKAFYVTTDSNFLYWRIDTWSGKYGFYGHDSCWIVSFLPKDFQYSDLRDTNKTTGFLENRVWAEHKKGTIWYHYNHNGKHNERLDGVEYGTYNDVVEGKIPLHLFDGYNYTEIFLQYKHWQSANHTTCDYISIKGNDLINQLKSGSSNNNQGDDPVPSTGASIVVDGYSNDWQHLNHMSVEDPKGDQRDNGDDLKSLWYIVQNDRLYIIVNTWANTTSNSLDYRITFDIDNDGYRDHDSDFTLSLGNSGRFRIYDYPDHNRLTTLQNETEAFKNQSFEVSLPLSAFRKSNIIKVTAYARDSISTKDKIEATIDLGNNNGENIAEAPALYIQANGSDGPVTISEGDPLSITLSLDPGGYGGLNADWWIAALTSAGEWKSLSIKPEFIGWVDGLDRSIAVPLFDLNSIDIPSPPLLSGQNFVAFALDDNDDGMLDVAWLDFVQIDVLEKYVGDDDGDDTGVTTGSVNIPQTEKYLLSKLKISSASDDDIFINANTGEYQKKVENSELVDFLIVADEQDNPVLFGIDLEDGSMEIGPKSTAIALVVTDPILSYNSKSLMEEIIGKISQLPEIAALESYLTHKIFNNYDLIIDTEDGILLQYIFDARRAAVMALGLDERSLQNNVATLSGLDDGQEPFTETRVLSLQSLQAASLCSQSYHFNPQGDNGVNSGVTFEAVDCTNKSAVKVKAVNRFNRYVSIHKKTNDGQETYNVGDFVGILEPPPTPGTLAGLRQLITLQHFNSSKEFILDFTKHDSYTISIIGPAFSAFNDFIDNFEVCWPSYWRTSLKTVVMPTITIISRAKASSFIKQLEESMKNLTGLPHFHQLLADLAIAESKKDQQRILGGFLLDYMLIPEEANPESNLLLRTLRAMEGKSAAGKRTLQEKLFLKAGRLLSALHFIDAGWNLGGALVALDKLSGLGIWAAYDRIDTPLSISITPPAGTISEGSSATFQADVSGGRSPYSYAWDFGDGKGSSSSSPGHAYTATGNYTVILTVTDSAGASKTASVKVSVEKADSSPSGDCGAYVANGVWKEFDCYNLAAIGKTTNDDPFTPSWRLIGGYWGFGRKGPEDSDWYDTNTSHFAHGPTGPDAEDANNGSTGGWVGGIKSTGDWSAANDPCPAGKRVPTKIQWKGVCDNNTQSTVGTWTTSATNYSAARFFGSDLMLPAAGNRSYSWDSGALANRGSIGRYWSSSGYGIYYGSWYLGFTSGHAEINDTYNRSGFSVRCIAE